MARRKLTEAQQTFLKMGSLEANPNGATCAETEIPLSQLTSWPNQPRKYFPPSHVEQLASSIRRQGLNYALTVRPAGEKYEVIVGECRLQACHLAPLDPVPVKIQPMDDQQALELALSENLDREDLNPIEVLESLLQILVVRFQVESEKSICSLLYSMKRDWEALQASKKEVVAAESGTTRRIQNRDIDIPNPADERQQLVAQTLKQYGYNWYSYTCNQLKLRDLPKDIYNAIAQGKIEYSKGLRFKSIKDAALRSELLKQAIQEGWSQREIRQRINERLSQISANEQESTKTPPQSRLTALNNRLKKSKLWQSHPKEWKKVESRLKFIESLLFELEDSSTLADRERT